MKAVRIPRRVLDRVMSHVQVGAPEECWPWVGRSIGSHGYGQIGWRGDDGRHMVTSHRAVWTLHHGHIASSDTVVDHLCHNRACCNPAHLQLTTRSRNAQRSSHTMKTHCPHGHPYAGANLIVTPRGHRRCRTCNEARRGGERVYL